MVVQNDFLMLGIWTALDALQGGSESLQPRRSLSVLAGESQPCARPRARSPLGNPVTLAGWEGGSQAGTGWHLDCGRSPSPSSWPQTPWSLPTWTSGSATGIPGPWGCGQGWVVPLEGTLVWRVKVPSGMRRWLGPSWVLMLAPNCKPSHSFSVQELDL